MNHRNITIFIISLTLVALAVAGCASPKTLALAEMNAWRIDYNDSLANARITFSPGNKCSLDILQPSAGRLSNAFPSYAYEIVVNDQTYQNYYVGVVTLDEGKSLTDLEEFDKTAIGSVRPPSFSDLQAVEIVPPMSRTFHGVKMPDSPIYFVCVIQGPDDQRVIEEFGPVEVKQ